MKRRKASVPEIDMTSMMGLSAILIVLLLTASSPPYAAIESNLPAISDHGEPDETVIPKVGLTVRGAWVSVPGGEPQQLSSIDDIDDALVDLKALHATDGRWEIIPDADVPYDDIIRAIDVARTANFDAVTFAAGVHVP